MRTTLVACGISLLVLAGCGGGDDKKEASPTTSAQASGASTTLRPVETSFTGQGSAEFCNQARTFNDRFGKVGPNATVAQLRTSAREGLAAINQAVGVAPAEIKADVQVISTAFASIVADLEKVNFDFKKVTADTFTKFQAPEFGASTQRFQAYMTNVCKIPS